MRAVTTIVLLAVFASCSIEQAPLVASDVVVAKPRPGTQMTAGYLTLSNHTTQSITITHVTSPQFASVEMHETVLEDGMARMNPLGELTILAGTSVQFAPGGKHLMLTRPDNGIDAADLQFYAGEALLLTVTARLTD